MKLALLLWCAAPVAGPPSPPALRVELGVTASGEASPRWEAMIRKRLGNQRYAAIAALRRPLTPAERAWAALIHARREAWEGEIPGLARLFAPVAPPAEAVIVLGYRGGEDAFTHDSATIGFDLAALQRVYGEAGSGENRGRIDRLFRHEYAHLLQKAWLAAHPYPPASPLHDAIAEIWAEGLGVYFSMSDRWRATGGVYSETAAAALGGLQPTFASRLAALACASPDSAAVLTADLSNGQFDRKWGALPAALWLDAEASRSPGAARRLVLRGPDGVWNLADRALPDTLRAVVRAARSRECGPPGG
jgi:hypothetical protein